jgi:hypothetical protein
MGAAVRLWRRREPHRAESRDPGFEVHLERQSYGPGETVRGSVLGGSGRELEVSLSLHERSPEYEAIPVTISVPLDAGEGGSGARRFAVEVPDDAPPSLMARHGALWWTVDAAIEGPDSPAVVSREVEIRSAAPTGPGSDDAEALAADRPPRR